MAEGWRIFGDVSALLPRNPSPSILIPIVSGVLWNVLLRIGFMDRCLHLVSCQRRCDADKSTTFLCFFSGFKTEFFSEKAIACHRIIMDNHSEPVVYQCWCWSFQTVPFHTDGIGWYQNVRYPGNKLNPWFRPCCLVRFCGGWNAC